jgi:hypothetical protein
VFYDCDNPDFEDFITEEFYDTAYGSYSDISTLAPFLKCAAVNLSCGYYNAHTKSEYVVANEMDASIEAACKILERTTEEDKFEYIEAKHSYGGYYSGYYYGKHYGGSKKNYSYGKSYGYDSYDEYDDVFTNYYLIEYNDINGKSNWWETYAVSETEAVGRFLMWHPTLCYSNIIDVMVDKAY